MSRLLNDSLEADLTSQEKVFMMNHPPSTRFLHFKGGKYVLTGYSLSVDGDKPVLTVLYKKPEDYFDSTIPFSRSFKNFTEDVDRGGDYGYMGARFYKANQFWERHVDQDA